MCNHDTTIGKAIRSKIKAMGIKQSVAMRMIAKHCDCSPITVYGWLTGGRPLRKYLPGISNALNLRESRLQDIWLGTAVAAKASDTPTTRVAPRSINSFVPNVDDLQVAVSLVKLGKDRRDNVLGLVNILELGRNL
jgi:hypothetical protein